MIPHSPSLATPVDYGPPLPSAAPSGPATSAALFLSPLQQTHWQESASWALKTLLGLTLHLPLVPLMIWGSPTTLGGFGAPPLEEEVLTHGLTHTSLMRIEIRGKKVGGLLSRWFRYLSKVLAAIVSHPPPSSSLQNRFKQGRLVPLASFKSLLQLW